MTTSNVLNRFGMFIVAALLCLAPAAAQAPKIDAEQRQLLLATSATLTMQQELDGAARQGFRVVAGTSRGNSEVVLLLERELSRPERYEYKLISTTDTITFQTEIDAAAREGYRAVARTFITKPHAMSVTEIAVVMERAPGLAKRYAYQLLATTLTSTLEKEWTVATSRGYALVGFITRSELLALLEREAK